MVVRIEFYGIPRRRAGVAHTTLELRQDPTRLGEVLKDLAARFPQLGADCVVGERLRLGYTANLSGRAFVTDPETHVRAGDSLLILHADAGG
jgi:molybdopterin converting factor small subunit